MPKERLINEELEIPREMVFIPKGFVFLGSTDQEINWILGEYSHHEREWFEDEIPQRKVEVNAFLIDRFPVTNADFSKFVEDTAYVTQSEQRGYGVLYDSIHWKEVRGASWKDPAGNGQGVKFRLDHPVVHVSWVDAINYCQWAGKRLVREVEWERAAKGDGDKRWPWGNDWNRQMANSAEYWARVDIKSLDVWQKWWKKEFARNQGVPKTTPVGYFKSNISKFGVYDLSGNVYEITQDYYEKYDINKKYDDMYEAIFGKYRVARGGSWMNFEYQVRCSERIAIDPNYSNFATGFRCAKDV